MHRRLAIVLAALLASSCLIASPASAHGGHRLTIRVAGGYLVEVYALLVHWNDSYAIDYTSYLRDRHTDYPVDDARVLVSMRTPGGHVSGPFTAAPFANSYEVLLPVENPNVWRKLRLDVRIDGRQGSTTFFYAPPSLASAWFLEPTVFVAAVVALLLFLQGFIRLRRRGREDHAPWTRLALFLVALALIVLPLVSPLDPVADSYLLSAHMLEHVLIADAAAALLLVALRGPLFFFFWPKPVLRALGTQAPLRRLLGFIARTPVAVTVWAIVYAAWHVPAAYDYVLTHQTAHDLEHVTFVAAGLLVWAQLIDPARTGRLSVARRLGVAAMVLLMGMVLADLLIFARHPLYPAYAAQAERLFGFSPLFDQRLAGLVMMIEQALSIGTLVAVLLLRHLDVGVSGQFTLSEAKERAA